MLPDAVKAEQEPEPAPRRREPRQGLPRSYWLVGGLVLVIVAAVGLCRVSGLADKLRPLPTPTITPLPVLGPGGKAVVKGTGAAKLKLRVGPGLKQETLLFIADGTVLSLLAGPQAGDGYNWWQVQTPDGLTGWVAGDWLEPVAH